MDAFLKFLSNRSKYKNNLFISEPPNPVILIWSSFEKNPVLSGITIVKQIDTASDELVQTVTEIFNEYTSDIVPFLIIEYKDDISTFIINGKKFNNIEAAKYISKTLNIKLGSNPAKKPNNPSQINDPFHIWSRDVFDGTSVRKIDLDAIILSTDHKKIDSLIEIKRSIKNPINKWLPYMNQSYDNNDYWNYIICFSLCKILKCNFITIHHELMNSSDIFEEETRVEFFEFNKATLISNETVLNFYSEDNRKVSKGIYFYSDEYKEEYKRNRKT